MFSKKNDSHILKAEMKKEEEGYIGQSEALRFDEEVFLKLRQDRDRSYMIAFLSMVAVILSVAAVLGLTPLKEKVPLIIEVEKATGHAHVLTTLEQVDENLGLEVSVYNALTRYFINRYVVARESWYPLGNILRQANIVTLSSTEELASAYKIQLDPKYSNSFIKIYGKKSRKVEVKSINFLNKETVLVRFSVERGGDNDEIEHYIANMRFRYIKDQEISFENRVINPTGFTVFEYKVQREAIK